jgi:hypothetical protein
VHWEGRESPQREREDSIDRSDAWDGLLAGGDGWGGFICEGEACDGPQGGSNGWDSLQREQEEPIDQFCSSCN